MLIKDKNVDLIITMARCQGTCEGDAVARVFTGQLAGHAGTCNSPMDQGNMQSDKCTCKLDLWSKGGTEVGDPPEVEDKGA